jgi:integrase
MPRIRFIVRSESVRALAVRREDLVIGAMDLLQSGVNRSVIALWLGHESVETTRIYLDASLAIEEQALAKTTPLLSRPGRYKPGDRLMDFLNGL